MVTKYYKVEYLGKNMPTSRLFKIENGRNYMFSGTRWVGVFYSVFFYCSTCEHKIIEMTEEQMNTEIFMGELTSDSQSINTVHYTGSFNTYEKYGK
jgi:hypothetical protein